ncbi:hypothetical protein [Dysgonomonas sp. 25]|uniref:hypothetical protein n=1 Tax=Dysgonomonas sp. 25 TaxID=2302933 RepID=UPI0013D1FAE9|nr:hypothetical protein [Dysgonomonas sp. 25]NDV69138.1 hypothetical protein [Dysgonomonas sp. 25]
MAFNLNDFLSKKLALVVVALLIAAAVITYKLYKEGVLFSSAPPIDNIYQNNDGLIISDTIAVGDTANVIEPGNL